MVLLDYKKKKKSSKQRSFGSRVSLFVWLQKPVENNAILEAVWVSLFGYKNPLKTTQFWKSLESFCSLKTELFTPAWWSASTVPGVPSPHSLLTTTFLEDPRLPPLLGPGPRVPLTAPPTAPPPAAACSTVTTLMLSSEVTADSPWPLSREMLGNHTVLRMTGDPSSELTDCRLLLKLS